MKHVGVYFQSWSSKWTSDPATMDLTLIDPSVTLVYISFANPATKYVKGSRSFSGTGLDFIQDFNVVADSITLLQKRKVTVMLSVGGATYPFSTVGSSNVMDNYRHVVALARDLGCNGIDIDWEPKNGAAEDAAFSWIIQSFKSYMWSEGKLSAAVFSTGAYGKNGSTYQGMNIKGLTERGSDLDWINLMAYDAGPPPPTGTYSPLGAYSSYRVYYQGPILFGLQPGPMGWGGHLITLDEVKEYVAYVEKESTESGIFIWSYQKNTAGSPSVKEILDLVSKPFVTPSPTPSTPITFTPPSKFYIACHNCKTKVEMSIQ